MIALPSCVGKLYHLILSRRMTSFLTSNGIIDPTVQKAFIRGINGCVEHNVAMEEMIRHAKLKRKTLHIPFLIWQTLSGVCLMS